MKTLLRNLNTNWLREKSEVVREIISNNIDICLKSDTKLDETFPK